MIPHLEDRVRALHALGWTGRDAEWLGLVCLHSGVFLRAQYLAFLGASHPERAGRFVRRCGRAAVEEPWNGSARRLCRIAARPLYQALGAEHVRHRREASPAVVLRRLLSLDYVLDHLTAPWLATEPEKVAALTAAGAPEPVLPQHVYQGTRDTQRRYFVHKLPLALDAARATFVFVQAEDDTASGVRTWGASHAALWAALSAAGRAVEVVAVGRDPVRLAEAGRVLNGWASTPAAADVAPEAAAEFAAIRTAVAAGNLGALDAYGGVNGALTRMRALVADEAGTGRARPAITRGRTWRSTRVPA